MTRKLLEKEGIYSGVSSGAAVVGALRWIEAQGKRMKGKNVLIILPDSGNRYLSKVYSDDWMREAGFMEERGLGTVQDLLIALHVDHGKILMANQSDKVSSAIELMREKGISQLPVIDDAGWVKGVLTEGAILTRLYEGHAKPSDTLEGFIDPSIEFVTLDDPIQKVSRMVTEGKIPLVTSGGKGEKDQIVAILTKIDLLSYLGTRT